MQWDVYGWVALGVFVSIAIPAARKAIQAQGLMSPSLGGRLWEVTKPYIPYAVLTLAVPVVILALTKETLDQRAAIVAGYAWDSTVQKFSGKP